MFTPHLYHDENCGYFLRFNSKLIRYGYSFNYPRYSGATHLQWRNSHHSSDATVSLSCRLKVVLEFILDLDSYYTGLHTYS